MLPGSYESAIVVRGNANLLFVGTGATYRGPMTGAGFDITDGANVEFRDLTINLVSLAGGQCGYQSSARSTLTFRGAIVAGEFVRPLFAGHCTLKIVDSEVHSPDTAVITLASDAIFEAERIRVVHSGMGTSSINALGERIKVRIVNSVLDHVSVIVNSHDPSTGSTQSEFYFAFNTFVVTGTSGGTIGCTNPSNYRRKVHFENNILVFPQAPPDQPNGVDGTACTFEHNITYRQEPDLGGTNVDADPKFVDHVNRDYRLQPTSPGIDTAVPSMTFTPSHDFAGVERPQGAQHDIGAYELAP